MVVPVQINECVSVSMSGACYQRCSIQGYRRILCMVLVALLIAVLPAPA